MGLKSFIAWQATCDLEGCQYIIELDDVELWTKSADSAREAWNEDNWTDGKAYICDEHRSEPHDFVGDDEYCDRCGKSRMMSIREHP